MISIPVVCAAGFVWALSILWLWRSRNAARRAEMLWFRLYLREMMPSVEPKAFRHPPDPVRWETDRTELYPDA